MKKQIIFLILLLGFATLCKENKNSVLTLFHKKVVNSITSTREVINRYHDLNTPNTLDKKKEVLRRVKEIDFNIKEYPINIEQYDVATEKIYKEAFYKAITNQIPIEYTETGALYYLDYQRFINEVNDAEFAENFIKNRSIFYYMDYDGDGLPELIIDTDGPRVFKYFPQEGSVTCVAGHHTDTFLLGAGQMYYHTTGLDYDRYIYYFYDEESMEQRHITFEMIGGAGGTENKYIVSVDELEDIEVSKKDWEIITKDFFSAIENAVLPSSFEEVFGEDFIYSWKEEDSIDFAIQAYEDFLKGAKSIEGVDIEYIIEAEKGTKGIGEVRYTFFDIDRGGLPELCIQTEHNFFILRYQNNTLFVWKTFLEIPDWKKYYLLKNGDIITQYNDVNEGKESYACICLEPSGHEMTAYYMSRTDINRDGDYNEKDYYEFNGEMCTWGEWTARSRSFLKIDESTEERIRNQAEWNIWER